MKNGTHAHYSVPKLEKGRPRRAMEENVVQGWKQNPEVRFSANSVRSFLFEESERVFGQTTFPVGPLVDFQNSTLADEADPPVCPGFLHPGLDLP